VGAQFPHRVRYLPAWDHALWWAVVVVAAVMRAILGFLRARARAVAVPA
jgi:hypothetical protein